MKSKEERLYNYAMGAFVGRDLVKKQFIDLPVFCKNDFSSESGFEEINKTDYYNKIVTANGDLVIKKEAYNVPYQFDNPYIFTNRTQSIEYDKNGNIIYISMLNDNHMIKDVKCFFTYDTLNRLTTIKAEMLKYDLSYENGKYLKQTIKHDITYLEKDLICYEKVEYIYNNSTAIDTITYKYDNKNRLICDDYHGNCSFRLVYDDSNNIVTYDSPANMERINITFNNFNKPFLVDNADSTIRFGYNNDMVKYVMHYSKIYNMINEKLYNEYGKCYFEKLSNGIKTCEYTHHFDDKGNYTYSDINMYDNVNLETYRSI